MADAEGASPAMAQWFAAKEQHPDALLFFRMGDFYELFFADAHRAAAVLGIQLTQRGCHAGQPIDMCGVPIHAADAYLSRLIRAGLRVAIAEQTQTAKARSQAGGRAPLRREVVRIVTPGTLTETALLDPARANLLLALAPAAAGRIGASWIDISALRFETECVTIATLPALLARLDPAEILCPPDLLGEPWQARRAPGQDAPPRVPAPSTASDPQPDPATVAALLTEEEAVAASWALHYLRLTSGGTLPALPPPRAGGQAGHLQIDAATRASLEILSARDGGGHSLFAAIRRTSTAAGARLLAERLAAPLASPDAIAARQDDWAWLIDHPAVLDALRNGLRAAPDMARALGRVVLGRFTPRDLGALRDGQLASQLLGRALGGPGAALPPQLGEACTLLAGDPALGELLRAALSDPVPARMEDGPVIATGFDGELDAQRRLRDDARSAIAGLQLDLAQRLGVASLKIRHHQQLGYVVEVPAACVDRLRAEPGLVLRQSMASGARFSEANLSELDRHIAQAGEQAVAREQAVMARLADAIRERAGDILAQSAAMAQLDVAQASARLAEGGRWCRPSVTADAGLCIAGGRHPVVEAALPSGARFIANDCDLSPGRRLLLLTGPNMAGKSTFLRQNALIVVLAQAGLPVPAASAVIGVADRLFCRVGASDDLARGRSTFMVEMEEAAAILNEATPRSMVVIDEIGRGTATLDGLAIAWAMLEGLHNTVRCRTIFATHFHELARLAAELPQLRPHMVRVKEWKGGIVFLHEVAEGAGGRSWGVQVARLAGVPPAVVRRAGFILRALEARGAGLTQDVELPLFGNALIVDGAPPDADAAHSWSGAVNELLGSVDPDRMTPREAIDALYRLKALCPPADGAPGPNQEPD